MSDFTQRIIADINKTGFALELRVAQHLRNRDYHVATNIYFVDRDEEKGREVDIRALKNSFFEAEGIRRAVRHCLLIECKKSVKRPWIFFTSAAVSYDQSLRGVLSRGVSDTWIGTREESIKLREQHPWFREPDRGRSFYEGFSNDADANSSIQKAVLGAIKATIETHESDFAAGFSNLSNATFYYPIVVFQGELLRAYLSGSELVVTPVDHVLVSVHYRSTRYPSDDKHTVLVAREAAFPVAIEQLDDWLEICTEKFKIQPDCFMPVAGEPRMVAKKIESARATQQPAKHRSRKRRNRWADSPEAADR
jgi:hypothetical protein